MGYDVAVLGAVGIDTNIYLPNGEIDFNVEANFSENLDYIGQAGGYAARAYNSLGCKTAFIGFIGNDPLGNFIKEQFKKDGIDISGMMIDPLGTKRSINFMDRNGNRKNFYDGKGSMTVEPEFMKCSEIIQKTRFAHVNIVNWTRYLLPMLKDRGVIIASDLQDVVDPEDEYRCDYIQNSDYLFFSAVNFPDPQELIQSFLEKNNDLRIICGRGGEGCIYADKDGRKYFPAVEINRPVVDTNGAGDSLAAGFLSSYLLEGYSIEDAILRGQIAARYCCSIKANTDDLINRFQLNKYFDQLSS
ncbi:MAG: carbohydrate kinase [Candidatus Cloacimonas sp. SDB]|nr:MAG: carbohydrate kinase [Candidatus Cloacimonas sp. SDB]